jgi:hypothetical protein
VPFTAGEHLDHQRFDYRPREQIWGLACGLAQLEKADCERNGEPQQALKVGDYKQPLGKKYEQFKSEYLGQPPTKTPPQLLDFTADANPVFLKDVVDYMTECGYFKKPYTYDQLVDRSFYEKIKK